MDGPTRRCALQICRRNLQIPPGSCRLATPPPQACPSDPAAPFSACRMTCCDTWWPRTAPRTGRPWVSERLGVACAVGAIDSCRRLLPPAAREDSQDAHEHPRDLPMPLPRLHTSPFMIPVLSSLLPLSPPTPPDLPSCPPPPRSRALCRPHRRAVPAPLAEGAQPRGAQRALDRRGGQSHHAVSAHRRCGGGTPPARPPATFPPAPRARRVHPRGSARPQWPW